MTRAFVWASLLIGTVARAAPLFDPRGRALRQFASEDGYLMLTIARNLAIGNGLSIEEGTTLTNGTQPLMTFVHAGLFWLVGGDKAWGVVLVQVLGIVIGLLASFVLFRIGSRLLAHEERGDAIAGVAAATWYVAAVCARYTQNCLETGAAALLPMVVGLYFLGRSPGPDERRLLRRCAGLGALLGVAFWVRNDAVLLSGAVCLVILLSGARGHAVPLGRRIVEAGCVGFIALVIALPWLVFNQTRFGHLVPVSGISQGTDIPLGQNLVFLGSVLAEQISIVVLIPQRFETRPLVLVLAWTTIFVWCASLVWLFRKVDRVHRQWLAALAIWSLLVVGFYGAIYGAGWFIGRYLFVLSPWMALFSVALTYGIWKALGRPMPRATKAAALGFILVMSIGLNVRAHVKGMNNGHFQAVEWIEANVPEDAWVAAIQTGTVGFFHDRTYNLDGKVSPAALQARMDERIFEYVVERPIKYLVDWVGIAAWAEDDYLGSHFELVVEDVERNLAVLRRRNTGESRQASNEAAPGAEASGTSPTGRVDRELFASRTRCMAPCGVRFDAQAAENLAWAEVRDSRFVWNFDDDGASSEGFIAGHIFEKPGSYDVTVTVDRVRWKPRTITVRPPKRTVCVSPSSSFDGCPSASAGDHFETISAAYDAIGSNSHILLERGKSHGALPGNGAAGREGSYLLGAYGSGAKPRVTSDGRRPRSGWTFQDLNVSTVGSTSYNFTSDAMDHVVFHRIDSADGARRFVSMFTQGPTNWMFFENNLVKGDYVMFACCTGLVVKGNILHRTGAYDGSYQHGLRVAGTDHALIQDNVFETDEPHTSLTLRGGEGAGRDGSDWVLVQGNTFDKHTQCHPANDTSGGIERHIVWENNDYDLDRIGGCTICGAGAFTGHHQIIRNNVVRGEATEGLYVRDHPLIENRDIVFSNNQMKR